MTGRTIVITGASDGIGAAAARQLAESGDRLVLVGRSAAKLEAVARDVGAEHAVADFSRLDDVRRLASELSALGRIDVLANNAGGVFGDRVETVDGHERTLQVNHLAPFLLTNLLMPVLQAGDGVVVNTSSSAAKRLSKLDVDDLENRDHYSPHRAYGDAKLGNILFTRGLQRRFGDAGITSVAFDPGNVRTNFASDTTSAMRVIYRTPLARLVLISPQRGGENLRFFITGVPGTTWTAGGFYTQTHPATERNTNPLVHDDHLVEEHWRRSAAMVGID